MFPHAGHHDSCSPILPPSPPPLFLPMPTFALTLSALRTHAYTVFVGTIGGKTLAEFRSDVLRVTASTRGRSEVGKASESQMATMPVLGRGRASRMSQAANPRTVVDICSRPATQVYIHPLPRRVACASPAPTCESYGNLAISLLYVSPRVLTDKRLYSYSLLSRPITRSLLGRMCLYSDKSNGCTHTELFGMRFSVGDVDIRAFLLRQVENWSSRARAGMRCIYAAAADPVCAVAAGTQLWQTHVNSISTQYNNNTKNNKNKQQTNKQTNK